MEQVNISIKYKPKLIFYVILYEVIGFLTLLILKCYFV